VEELRKQQAELKRQQTKVRHLLYLIGIGIVAVLAIFAVTLTYIVVVSRGNKAASCELIETARAEKRALIAQYAENPPATQLGRDIEQSYRQSLAAWDNLWNTLGCMEVNDG
jgi:hypothetical protein